ncbi:MAG: SMC-Scp complex subunit ScpB [Gammaproteobacteria bacterium]|nr:SMC-Scp complex subunit ScpB [Gammaproteobacteria bacterium]
MDDQKLKNILEAILMSAGKPLTAEKLVKMFDDEPRPSISQVKKQLIILADDCQGRGIELVEVGSGFRYQGRQEYGAYVSKLWEVKPQRYSRALLETLALIAYRQPVTRADIEEVRGVSVSSSIMKTLLEREWVHVVGHRDVPGRPAMYATTKGFLDYFNLQSLNQLPTLSEISDLSKLEPELDLENKPRTEQNESAESESANPEVDVVELPSNESVH